MKRAPITAAFLFSMVFSGVAAEPSLEQAFENPPVNVRPYVWWHWMGSNFSKEGISKDLEAMKAAGIGGATIFNLTSAVQESQKPTENNPWPDQTYRSPKYWEALRHAASEAQRLGLEIGLHNTVGYSTTGGPWIDEEKNMQQVVAKSVTVEGGKRVTVEIPRPDPVNYRGWGNSGKLFMVFHDIAVLAVPADGVIDPTKVVDLSASFKNGRLDWDAPAGKWQVVRLARAPTGASPHPVPDELIGKTLEVDKLSLELNRFHWDQVIQPMKEHLGPYLGKSFKHFLIDSYEAGAQNWTTEFRDEFRKRKGYDPMPWLLTLQKRVVGNTDLSARFKWDYNDVIRTLYYENGWVTGKNKMKAVGMDLQFEPYGGLFDTVEGAALADIPMGEFWTGKGGGINSTVVSAARAAGRTVVGAEAFTGPPTLSKWSETPEFLKQSADGTYASGANRLVLHHWVHQPFDDRYLPGMGMGWWGTHFNRNQTWAKDGKAFFQYLGRTQALLQAGETPVDYVSVGKSQGGDVIPWRVFRGNISVKDGRVILPSGRSYSFLGIPHDGRLTPEDVRKISDLLQQGAVIVCQKPSGAPGLKDYPRSDAEVKSSTLWNGGEVLSVGKGKLYATADISAAVRDLKISPLAEFPKSTGIVSTARATKSETLFFVANTTGELNNFTGSFRVVGKRPELWDAEDGSIRFAPVWRQKDGRTEVDLTLGGNRSIFVVFRDAKMPADHVVSISSKGKSGGGLRISKARFGTPEGDRWLDVTAKLQELGANGLINIKSVTPGVFGRDPAPNVVKTLEVEYSLSDTAMTAKVAENGSLKLGGQKSTSDLECRARDDGSVMILSAVAGQAEAEFASGRRETFSIGAPPATAAIAGPWQVSLDSPVQEKRSFMLEALGSLANHEDPEVKYFSGTATYSKEFEVKDLDSKIFLDLGEVHNLARVVVNGKDLGVLWQNPFTLEITSALKVGKNQLSVSVTNTWHNRLVGDEQFPADFEWGQDRDDKGHAMKSYPEWFLKNQPRPEKGRKCFVVWYYHRKDTKLLPSGLVGPITIVSKSSTLIR